MKKLFAAIAALQLSCLPILAQAPMDGGVWKDNTGKHINAHGGSIFNHKGTYYWYGESRSENGKPYSSLGVSCFTSKNLKDWTNHGLVLPVSNEAGSDIEGGCIIERPKVLYNAKTKKFVMWFHLELKGRGYGAARAGVAVSDTPFGPFKFVRSGRVNAGLYPIGFAKADTTDLRHQLLFPELKQWWTPEWRKQIERGMFFMRDLQGGQMARDMTVFVDDDGKAYHIFSSEDNLTIQIAQLTDDYMERIVCACGCRWTERGTHHLQEGRHLLDDYKRMHRLGSKRCPYVPCQEHFRSVGAAAKSMSWRGCQQDFRRSRHIYI